MGLVRLLTVGKALSEGKDWPGRYRMPCKNSLPNFGSKGSSRPHSPPDPRAGPQLIQPELIRETVEPVAQAAAGPETRGAAGVETACPSAVPTQPPKAARRLLHVAKALPHEVISGCSRAFSTLMAATARLWDSAARRLPFWPRTRATAYPVGLAQADLPRLDSVKVMRNDLSDSDFAVVPKQPGPKQPSVNPFSSKKASVAGAGPVAATASAQHVVGTEPP
jgi:hypothetical protein